MFRIFRGLKAMPRYTGQAVLALLALFVALLPSGLQASAQITLDATSQQTGAAGIISLSWSHVLGSGGSRMIVCGVTLAYNDTAVAAPLAVTPSMTFDGLAMTASVQAPTHAESSTAKIFSQIFYIDEAGLGSVGAGTYNVVLTIPTAVTGGASGGCTSLFGVNQAAPEATATGYSGSSTAVTDALTTITAGDWVIDAFAGGYGSNGSATPNTGQTKLYNIQSAAGALTTGGSNGGNIAASSYELVANPGIVSVGWTATVARQAYAAAAFAPTPTTNYTVSTSVSPTGGGTITLSPSQASYPSGTSVQVTANPSIGYSFSSFSGAVTGTTNPATLVVNGNKSVTATFVASQCVLTINVVGSGTVTPASGSTYVCGTPVTITATPGTGYSFGQFSGALTGTTNPQTLTLNTSSTVTATFVQGTPCTLATSVTGSGSITVNPAGTVFSCGTSLTVTAVPAKYFSLTGFSGALTGTTNPQIFTINSNSTIGAAFAQTNYPINVTIAGPGTVTANPVDSGNGYAAGTSVTLTATPNSGAFFNGFSGSVTSTTSPATTTVNAAENVTATFTNAVITKDAVSHAASTSASATTLTWQHTLGSGSSRAMVIAVGETDSLPSPDPYAVVNSVTFNGVYATPIPNSTVYGGTSGMVQTQLFYLLESELPAAGTYTVQVNLAGPIGGISAGAVSLIGVNQGPPEAVATNKNTSGADLISTPITTLTNNAWVVDLVEDGDVAALTANAGQTLAWQAEAASGTGGSSTEAVATAGAVTLGWAGSANRLAQSLAAFPPATATIPATYTLASSVAGGVGGTITANPGLSAYPVGTGVLLTATPQTGYAFSSWSGDYTSTSNPLPITMASNHNVVANFAVAATCSVTINIVGSGTLNIGSGVYNCGTVLQLVATPASGYTFTSFSGALNSTDNPSYFTLSANSTITAEFDAIPQCSLAISNVGQGSVSPGSGSYACGSVLTLQATAGSGYAFSGYSGDYVGTGNPATITLNQNMNITATFLAGSGCTLTTSVTGQGTITPSSGTWACGTVISMEADAAAKYLFNGWGGALSGSTTPTTLTMSANENVTASFVVNIAGVTGDTRTVTQPVYPAVCTVLTAVQSVSSPLETAPDTTRVQAALNACPSGQAVEFSANGSANAFIIQPITLPAGVTMLVDPEITILGSIKYADYSCSTSANWCTPLISVAPNAYPSPGSAIMGLGVIDGRGGVTLTDKGESWWATGQDARPRLVYLSSHTTGASSDNFTAYQITLQNSPKFHLSGVGNDLTVWGVKIKAPPDSPNTDGIDPSGSSNITITKSYISDGDDWISPKADSGHISNVTIDYNYTYSGHGISIGSETNAGLNNMYVHDIVIDNGFGGTSFDSLRIKSGASEGGEVYDVLYQNICINNGGDTIVIDPYYTSATGTLYPNFHDITFSNVHKLLHNSSYKSTMTGYNTNGVVFPLTVTLDNIAFDNDSTNDFKAPDNFNNVQFTFGPGPVSMASFLEADAAVPTNYITVTNSVSNSNAPYNCTGVFVYLAGDLTAPKATVTAGTSPAITAVLQNLVSPLVAGTVSYAQQNAPTGTIQLLEGTNVVGTGTINGRLTYITVQNITAGTHVYTAQYLGDSHYSPLSFGNFTLVATSAAPVAANQSVTVSYNTATPITLTATGSGTLTYSVATNPTHGTLTGTAPNLTYTPTAGYSGADSFTFTASNGATSNVATVSITVQPQPSLLSQTITFPAPVTPVTYGAAPITLTASASSGLAVSYSLTGPGSLNGNVLSFTGVGSIVVTASQAGNSSYTPATPVQQTVVVNPVTTTLILASLNPSSVTSGTVVTLSATLLPAIAGETVSFLNGSTVLGNGITNTSGLATYSLTAGAAGTSYTLSASFAATGNYGASASTSQTLTVTAITTTTTLAPLGSSSVASGSTVTLSATVTPAVAGETVSFLNGTATLGTGTTNASGVATYTLTAGAAGTLYTLSASFAATGNYGASASTSQTLTVSAITTTTTLAPLGSSSVVSGSTVTLSATVTPAVAGETVSFLNGTASLGTGTTNTSGVATYTLTAGAAGTSYTLSASFAATGNYGASASTSQTLTVTAITTTTTLAPLGATVITGSTLTLSATVLPAVAGETVSFLNGTAALGIGTTSASGVATYTLTAGAVGTSYTLSASFVATGNYGASTSASQTVTVIATPNPLTLTVTPSISIAPGASGTVTLTVTPANGYTGAVALTCSSPVTYVTCSVAPSSVTLSGTAAVTGVGTISVAATTASLERSHGGIALAMLAPFGLLGLALASRKRKILLRRAGLVLVLAVGIVAAACGVTGCGGGVSSSGDNVPPGTQIVTFTGTAAGVSQSATVTVNIN